MRLIKLLFLTLFVGYLSFLISCSDDEGEKLSGQMLFVTSTTGDIDPGHQYLIEFSGLVGELEIPDGIVIGINDQQLVPFNRVGEQLTVYLSNIPAECADNVSSSSSTGSQLASGGTPNDPDHPDAQYQSIIIVPVDGSEGNLTFTIICN